MKLPDWINDNWMLVIVAMIGAAFIAVAVFQMQYEPHKETQGSKLKGGTWGRFREWLARCRKSLCDRAAKFFGRVFGWMADNPAISIAIIVCVTLIVLVALRRPPRYQKMGPSNAWVLDTHTGKILYRGAR